MRRYTTITLCKRTTTYIGRPLRNVNLHTLYRNLLHQLLVCWPGNDLPKAHTKNWSPSFPSFADSCCNPTGSNSSPLTSDCAPLLCDQSYPMSPTKWKLLIDFTWCSCFKYRARVKEGERHEGSQTIGIPWKAPSYNVIILFLSFSHIMPNPLEFTTFDPVKGPGHTPD